MVLGCRVISNWVWTGYLQYCAITPPTSGRGLCHLKLGAQKLKTSSRQRFGHRVSQLILWAQKPNKELFSNHLLSHKVEVDFDMLGARVKHRIRGKKCGANIVAPKGWRGSQRHTQFGEKILKPKQLRTSERKTPVFSFSAGTRHCWLFLSTPGDQIVAKKNSITRSGTTVIDRTSPISVTVSINGKRVRWPKG